MKKILLTLIIGCGGFAAFAQQDSVVQVKEIYHYIFEEFTQGIVTRKSGNPVSTLLNYNTLTEEMIFDNNGEKLALTWLENIDTVYVGGKIFIPVGKVFYERVTNTPAALYIQHKTDVIPPGKNTAYDGTTQSGSVTTVTSFRNNIGKFYPLALPDDYKLSDRTVYWLKKDDGFIKLNSINKLAAAFPEKAEAIKSFAKTNRLNFNNADDVAKLVAFCN